MSTRGGQPEAPPRPRLKVVHTHMEEELWRGLWEVTKRRFVCPTRKFHVVLNEAIREYLERHREELQR